jgi:hypothetical protein
LHASQQERVPLRTLLPGSNYASDEEAYAGSFIHPYVSKYYPDNWPSTEVVSMGVERFASAATILDFYLRDRAALKGTGGAVEKEPVLGHFPFVLGLVRDRATRGKAE